MEETIEFEFLSSNEQQQRLEEVMENIKRMHPEEVIAGTFDISDISFGRLSNGDIVYTLKLNDPNSPNGVRYEHYKSGPDKTLKKEDLPDEKTIEQYKATGANVVGLENQAAEYKKLENDETAISLVNLREANSELIQTAEALGISPEEVEYYVKINGNAEPVIDSEKVKNVQQSTDISGNEMITTRSSMNDIVGMNYANYRIIKQQNGVHILGITQDGGIEDITSNFDISNSQTNMSLMTGNGNIRDVSVVGYFRLKSSSSIGRDQAFGLCNNNGHIDSFYARGALGENMLGRAIPCQGYSNESVAKEKATLEERFNKDITSEAKEAEARTSNSGVGIDAADNLVTDPYDIQDLSSQIETTADNYGIDADVLTERVEEELSDNPDRVAENVVEEVAEEMDEEQDHSEPEEDDGYDHEPGLGSPWGNIDNF